MSDLFVKLLNISLSASYLVAAVVLLRLLLKKAPKWVNPVLWGVVGARLLFPVSVESVLSLLPSAQPIPPDIAYVQRPAIHSGIPAVNHAVNPVIAETFAPAPAASANPLQILLEIGGWLWLAGLVLMLLYTAVSYLRLRRRVSTAVKLRENQYQCETVASPFVLGLFRPRIYLPFGLPEEDIFYIVAHEEAHIRRRDHWWKPLGFVLLAVHWFNPLMWLAYCLLCRDIELACDEKVIRRLGREGRADYSQALLSCSVSRRSIAACPLAFGEVGVKERVKSVLKYQRPLVWVVDLSVLACAIFAICFLTNPPLKLPFMEEQISVSEAVLSEHDSPAQAEFSEWDREDLGRRLHDLEKIRPYDPKKDGGIDPAYHLSVTFENGESLTLDGDPDLHRDTQETVSEIILEYDGKRYRVEDPDFSSWMYGICAKKNIAQGSEEAWGLRLSMEKVSPTAATVLFTGGDPALIDEELLCSNDYTLQKWEAVGWVDLPRKENPNWTQAAAPVSNSRRHFISWEWLYGQLSDGKYRLGKKIWYRPEQGGEVKDVAIVWGEFILGHPSLTLADVLRLSQKGEDLDWQDFEGYPYEDIGFGFYIRRYDLEDPFSLRITAGNPDGEIQSIALCCELEDYAMVDIRTGDIDAFLSIHQQEVSRLSGNHWGLDFDAIDITPTGCSAIFWQRENRMGETFSCNEGYVLQTRDRQGRWTPAAASQEPYWSDQNTFSYAPQEIQWEDWLGTLPDGEYRLGKEVTVHYPQSDIPERVMVYAEFGLRAEGRKHLTPEDLTRLLENPENLNWDDFEGYIYSEENSKLDVENMQYMRHYTMPGSLRLHLSGSGESQPLHRLLLQCSEDEDMAFLFPNRESRPGWNREKSEVEWGALGMKEFLKIHSRPRPNEDTNHWGINFSLGVASREAAFVWFEADLPIQGKLKPSDQYRLYGWKDGRWEALPTLPGQEWPELEIFSEANLYSGTINWADRYGVLPEGTYRLSKNLEIEASDDMPMQIWLPKTVSAEFTVHQVQEELPAVAMTVQEAGADHVTLNIHLDAPLPEGACFIREGYNLESRQGDGWKSMEGEKNPSRENIEVPTDKLTAENGPFLIQEQLRGLPEGRYRIGKLIGFGRTEEKAQWSEVSAEFEIRLPKASDLLVSMSARDFEFMGMGLYFYRPDDAPQQPLYTNGGFTCEKWDGGDWKLLASVPSRWDDAAASVDFSHLDAAQVIEYEILGQPPRGLYRITKELAFSPDGAGAFPISAEFTIDPGKAPFAYQPLEKLPRDYTRLQASVDGCLVMTDGTGHSGRGLFTQFLSKTAEKKEAFLRFVSCYTGGQGQVEKLYVHDLNFDGNEYHLRWLEKGRAQEKIYQYLKAFEQPVPLDPNKPYVYSWYVLTNDENLEMPAYAPEEGNRTPGVVNEHEVVYSEKTFRMGPQLHDVICEAKLEWNGKTEHTVTDEESLWTIHWLLSSAAAADDNTDFQDVGLNLHLTLKNGEEVGAALDPARSLIRMDGKIFSYEELGGPVLLWEYLGIRSWPEAVYEEYPNAMR